MGLDINRKEIPVGTVVYYVDKYKYKTAGRTWGVGFGIVEEHYTTEICLQLLEPRDTRRIDGIPIQEFQSHGPWHKLPKGWTYNTKLYRETYDEVPELSSVDIRKPEDILKAYRSGWLVKVQDNYSISRHVDTEIDSKHGWRIVLKVPPMHPLHRSYISLPFREIYRSYDEAKAVVDAEYAEFDRQAALSDYDWSVEQIDRTLDRWAALYEIEPERKSEARERLLDMKNVEELDTRLSYGGIQWKYEKNRRWNVLQV